MEYTLVMEGFSSHWCSCFQPGVATSRGVVK